MNLIDEIRTRWEKATPGPWVHFGDTGEDDVRVCFSRDGVRCEWCIALAGDGIREPDTDDGEWKGWTAETLERWRNDAEAIAHAPTDIRRLIALVESQAAEIDRLRDVIRAGDTERGGLAWEDYVKARSERAL